MNLQRVERIVGSLRALGVRRTVQAARALADDYRFDRKHGTDTYTLGSLDSLDVDTESREHAVAYAPTKGRHFNAIMDACEFPPDSVFTDVGSGKGKVLFLAADHGFAKVVGIEFSSDLCSIAEANIETLKRAKGLEADVEIINADATQYEIRPDQNVFFLFNPFDGEILERFVDNLARSVERDERPVWLIYNQPEHREILDSHRLFEVEQTVTFANTESVVYRTVAYAGTAPGQGVGQNLHQQ